MFKKHSSLLICPYCETPLKIQEHVEGFGTASCECDVYPILETIIYLHKDDSLLHKRIVDLIEQKKHVAAVWSALSTQRLTHRLVVFAAYLLKKKVSVPIRLESLLTLLGSIGPARSWFAYLRDSHTRNTFVTSVYIAQKNSQKNAVIIDIGCGIGKFFSALNGSANTNTTFVGLEKSFLSLLIASQFHASSKTLYVCCDTQTGLPFRTASATACYCSDTFAWIYSKKKLIAESARILKKSGVFIMINVHAPTTVTRWWGYGISAQLLEKIVRNYFDNVVFFKNDLTRNHMLSFVSPRATNLLGYSCIAQKK